MSKEPETGPEMEESPVETHQEWALRKKRETMKVSQYQARAALTQKGMLQQAQTVVDNSTDPLIQIAWEKASFYRINALIDLLGSEMGLTEQEIDDLFEIAKTIE